MNECTARKEQVLMVKNRHKNELSEDSQNLWEDNPKRLFPVFRPASHRAFRGACLPGFFKVEAEFPSFLLLTLSFLFLQHQGFAEGTKELAPNSTDVTMLYTCVSAFGSFAAYDGPADSRLHFYIDDPENEQVYLGFSRRAQTSNSNDGDLYNSDYYFRIKDPAGNVVFGPQLVGASGANADTWALANAGPAPVVGGSGYTPFTFDPSGLASGDYYVEFSLNQNTATSSALAIKFWDITVATTDPSPVAINGRVWSSRWSFRTPSISHGSDATYTYFDRTFNGQVYLYTEDQFVSKIDFNNSGFRGLSFNLAYNEYGVANTGDLEADRRSIENTNNTLAQFQIFLNDPDLNVYPNGSIGSVNSTPLVVNCDPNNLCVSYEVTEIGYVFILLDFDQNSGAGIYDQNTADVLLYEKVSGSSSPYGGCIPWDGLNGLGATVNTSSNIPVYMTYAQGMVHFPVYDVEYIPNGFQVDAVRPTISGFVQKIYYDDTNITDAPGNGSAKDMVNGCLPPCHAYTNLNYGNLNTINTWWFTNQDFVLTLQSADCILNAYDDSDVTDMNTPVTIDVTANDDGDNLDPTTVNNTGVLQPGNGSIAINPTTGAITYTPSTGFVGIDTFQYVVCETGFSPCDTANVIVTVNCQSVTGNVIQGLVYNDLNSDQVPDLGEAGEQGVTVFLYEDVNQDGAIDGGDNLLTSTDTDVNGEYSFSVTPSYPGSFSYEDAPGSSIAFSETSAPCTSGSELSRTINVSGNFIINDVDFGIVMTHTWRSDIRVVIESPAGTTVTVINNTGGSQDNFDLLLDDDSSNNIDDGNNDNTASPFYDRTAAPASPLSVFNGENANGNWTVRICDSENGDVGTYIRSKLDFVGAGTQYLLSTDLNDLPAGAVMVDDNLESATFIINNSIDCENNFPFSWKSDLSLSKTVSNANPTGGGSLTYTLQVANAGNVAATNVVVADTLPTGVSYQSHSGGSYSPTTGLWTVGTVAASGSQTLNIVVQVDSTGVWENVAQVTASDQPDPDSTPGNGDPTEDDRDSVCFSVNIPLCPGTSQTVSAPAGLGNYQWFRNGGAISGATSASYAVDTVFNSTDNITWTAVHPVSGANYGSVCPFIFQKISTTANAASTSVVCEGDNISLSENGGDAISWNWAGAGGFTSTAQNPTVNNASLANGGAYIVTITDAYGCTATSTTSTTVNALPLAGVASQNDTLCLEGSGLATIDLFAKLTGEDSGGTWTVVAGTPGGNFNAGAGSVNPNALPIATYTFRYTVNGASPCPAASEDWTLVIERCCPPNLCLPVTTTKNN